MKRTVRLFVTDLDDTLYDWVGMWYASFSAMLRAISYKGHVSRGDLIEDFRTIFAKHGTCEYAFAIEELESLRRAHPSGDLTAIYSDAIEDYRRARRAALRLYPDVENTLTTVKESGALIVAYTESQAFYSESRLRKLGLDRLIHYLFSPPDHDLPAGLTPAQIRRYPASHYELELTETRSIHKGHVKPNPAVLRDILDEFKVHPSEVAYVGDKLFKDVAMAQRAGVHDVWAAYGESHSREEYELLKAVTHWSPAAVAKEQTATEDSVRPTFKLEHSFGELLEFFDFEPWNTKLTNAT